MSGSFSVIDTGPGLGTVFGWVLETLTAWLALSLWVSEFQEMRLVLRSIGQIFLSNIIHTQLLSLYCSMVSVSFSEAGNLSTSSWVLMKACAMFI